MSTTRPEPLSLPRSEQLLETARALVPGLTHSMMKRPDQFCVGSFPTHLRAATDAVVTDVDGNSYVDYICGLGASALGPSHPRLKEAIVEALQQGILHSLPSALEVEVAEELVPLIPRAEMVRFFKTGADATTAAVRLARALTAREPIITVGYNGFHDHFMFDTKGVPAVLATLTSRHSLALEGDERPLLAAIQSGQHAAVVLSVPYNRVLGQTFLKQLRESCTQAGTLLILDEIVTGFRLALGGAQEFYGLEADIVCMSKALAGGMPLSAVLGPRCFLAEMENLQVSTTFGGERLSLAACRAALEIYRTSDYFATIHSLGERLKEGVNRVSRDAASTLQAIGYDPMPLLRFSTDMKQHIARMRPFVGLMAQRGILMRRDVNFICAAHTVEQIDATVEATRESLAALRAL